MTDHPTEEELVRLCCAREDDPEAPETRAHIQSGCPECSARLRGLKAVIASLTAPALREVPEAMVRKALAWIAEQSPSQVSGAASAEPARFGQSAVPEAAPSETSPIAPRSVSRRDPAAVRAIGEAAGRILQEIRATLVLDSLAGAVLPGIRGSTAASPRQLLHECSAGSILILVEPVGIGLVRVRGQWLPVDGARSGFDDRAIVEVGGHESVTTVTDSGEFCFESVLTGVMRLTLETGTARIVLDPFEP